MPKQRRSTRKFQADQAEDSHAVKRRAGLKKEELREALHSYTKEIDDHLNEFYKNFYQQSEHNIDMVKLELDVIKLALRTETVDAILQ